MALDWFRAKYGVQVSDSNTVSGYDLLPVGTMLYWAGPTSSIPNGWLLANGDTPLRSAYPNLNAFLALSGYVYGNGDGSTTFTLPDGRGRALRHGTFPTVYAGTETTTLGDSNIIAHSHTVNHSHGLPSHTHGGVTHSHPGNSHNHAAPHGHGASTTIDGSHTHNHYVAANSAPGTPLLRASVTVATTYVAHGQGGGNHDHNFGISDSVSATSGDAVLYTDPSYSPSTSSTTSGPANSNTGGISPSSATAPNSGSSRNAFSLMQPFYSLNLIIKA